MHICGWVNLYYGLVRGTPHKWLDLKALFSRVIPSGCTIETIKYYTAIVKARNDDPQAPVRQVAYLNALRAHIPEIRVKYGHFIAKETDLPLADGTGRVVRVIKTEEKGSDANLAVHLVHDAWQHVYDCYAIVTNDSDLAEAFRLVSQVLKRRLVLLIPARKTDRPAAIQLKRWTRREWTFISPEAVAASQLPNPIPNTNIHKPLKW
jgi:hypothetical protein